MINGIQEQKIQTETKILILKTIVFFGKVWLAGVILMTAISIVQTPKQTTVNIFDIFFLTCISLPPFLILLLCKEAIIHLQKKLRKTNPKIEGK